ncbi:universal stress protein [Oleiagrimonas sp.]|uniref:universal stress protein n=1 Tax=Oleiagrimonas sp. TaxID=2010330 RepID=UPI00261897D4|nr:universal stress protein [Oleiagrimonas sp.]MDA3912851.1 universal stress protein [Oleiagrimonas sp.]
MRPAPKDDSIVHRCHSGPVPVMGNVLALVTSTDPWSGAAQMATALAARWEYALTGCGIDPAWRELGASEASTPTPASQLSRRETAEDGARLRLFARERGVTEAVVWSRARAGIAHVLRTLGAWHDLAVLERDMVAPDAAPEHLGEALLGSRVPCLVLPPMTDLEVPDGTFQRIVVAWNGSQEATRALQAARPLLRCAREIHLLDGAYTHVENNDGLPMFDPQQALGRLGVPVVSTRVDTDVARAGEALLDATRRMRADLLVMGAYGRSLMRERAIGGATRYLLAHADLPVLMQH